MYLRIVMPYLSMQNLTIDLSFWSISWILRYCKLNIGIIPRKYAQRIERRQAEFLVKGSIPLNAISHVAVMNEVKQKIVQSFFNNVSTYIPKVTIKRHWYY